MKDLRAWFDFDESKEEPDSIQMYNIWNFRSCNESYGMEYAGRIPGQVVENLLYYFTEPNDLVVDPMCGGGTTIDVCSAMNRRVLGYDISPSRKDIIKHDITTGFPIACKNCDFVFLDPPYWSQKKGSYSSDETNLANVDIGKFYLFMGGILKNSFDILKTGGHLAYIISSSRKKDRKYFHGYELAKISEELGFEIVEWIDVPYTTQRATGFHINWAKNNKKMLILRRDLVVLRK